jgi:hypothetical protein
MAHPEIALVTAAMAVVQQPRIHMFEARGFLGDVAAPRERSNARRLTTRFQVPLALSRTQHRAISEHRATDFG